jgi:hypothetical protein
LCGGREVVAFHVCVLSGLVSQPFWANERCT